MRVLDVRVDQQGYELYHAELDDHAGAPTAGPREDPDNLAPPLPPSGPVCDAEIPRRIRVEVAEPEADVRLLYDTAHLEPPAARGLVRAAGAAGDARRASRLRVSDRLREPSATALASVKRHPPTSVKRSKDLARVVRDDRRDPERASSRASAGSFTVHTPTRRPLRR